MKMAWYVRHDHGIGATGEPGPAEDRVVVCQTSMTVEAAREVHRQLGTALLMADVEAALRRPRGGE